MAKNPKIREAIANSEYLFDAIILDNHYFDNSIIGATEDGRLVYSFDKMIDEYMKDEGCDFVEAYE